MGRLGAGEACHTKKQVNKVQSNRLSYMETFLRGFLQEIFVLLSVSGLSLLDELLFLTLQIKGKKKFVHAYI